MLFTILLAVSSNVMTKKDNEDFENSTKCWICENDYIDEDVKVRNHCHIT